MVKLAEDPNADSEVKADRNLTEGFVRNWNQKHSQDE